MEEAPVAGLAVKAMMGISEVVVMIPFRGREEVMPARVVAEAARTAS